MNKEDRRYLVMFIILILLLFTILIYEGYRNRKLDVDRKVELIFNTFSYDTVYETGKELFLNTIKISDTSNLEFARDNSNDIEYYMIGNFTNYKKLLEFTLISNTLSSKEITKYMNDKKIIEHDNHYYMGNNNEKINYDYIGSNIEISNYDDNYVYFTSINYYCKNSKYLGIIEENPNCEYTTKESNFTLVKENNNLRINDYQSIAEIIE